MRLLLTSQPIYSHLVPGIIPLAQTARARGHEVAVATAPTMAAELARHGITHLPLPHVPGQAELRADPRLAARYGLPNEVIAPGRRVIEAAAWRQIARAYAGPLARRFAEDLIAAADTWRPDVLVREPTEYGGYLAAEHLGIAHATLDYSPYTALDLPIVADTLNQQRLALGLDRAADPLHPHRYLRAGVLPESWYPPDLRLATGRYYRAPALLGEPALDRAIAGLPTDRPFILASLGSLVLTLPGLAEVLPTIIEALGRVDCTAVVTLGGRAELVATLPKLPTNVHVIPFVAQAALLSTCDLFVTHAGFNGVREALVAGVPMIALPSFSDQSANARRLTELGLGERLDIEAFTAPELADVCRRVLVDPEFRQRTRGMQRQIMACPGVDQLLDDLVELADRSHHA